MGIQVALYHKPAYRYDRRVSLSPQTVRLRPAPHCRTPILAYSMKVSPGEHYVNWQQDPYGNYLARLVFAKKTRDFTVEVDLVPSRRGVLHTPTLHAANQVSPRQPSPALSRSWWSQQESQISFSNIVADNGGHTAYFLRVDSSTRVISSGVRS